MRRFYIVLFRYTFFIAIILSSQKASCQERLISSTNAVQFIAPGDSIKNSITHLDSIFSKLLRMRPEDQLTMATQQYDNTETLHQRYQQYYKGIKVEHGIMIAHSKNNQLISINGNYTSLQDINTYPCLTEHEALTNASKYIHAKRYKWQEAEAELSLKKLSNNNNATYFPCGELVICTTNNQTPITPTLAYKFEVYAVKPLSKNLIYIDATTGKLLQHQVTLRNLNEENQRYQDYKSRHATVTSQKSTLYDSTRGTGIETLHIDNHFAQHDNNTGINSRTTKSLHAAGNAQWGAMMSYDYWKKIHHRNSFDGRGAKVMNLVHNAGAKFPKASWDGEYFIYANINNPFTTLDVCAHEFGHAITQYTSSLVYKGESGALNEGFSDIWAACVEYHTDSTKEVWLLGDELYPGSFIRSMASPKDSGQPDTYKGENWATDQYDNGGVHTNSGVLNYWFYLLAMGGKGTNDNGLSFSISRIRISKAEQIVYTAQFYLTPTAQYRDARMATIAAACQLYGKNSFEVNQVTAAWDAVGVLQQPPAISNAFVQRNDELPH